ncbi:MAG: Lrp/AsnC ligand binding domain-containing protein [Thermoplasmata archaeon]
MVSAYLLIKTETGKTKAIFNELSKLLKTKHKNIVFGRYDIVLKVKTRTDDDLIALINTKIRTIQGVTTVHVLQCWEEEESTIEGA